MKKIVLLILLGVLAPGVLMAQNETSNWFFGQKAGIQFNNDGSVSNLNGSEISTYEGCATISDTSGSLLFYTDGITVYNREHEIMLNGNNLFGDPSSTQSAIIVPMPENPDLYYIFTVDTSVFEGDPDFGLNYSVVDITGANGLGEVVTKNINLLQDCSEKVSAIIKDCFEKSIWVVTFASEDGTNGVLNTFHAFEVNAAGVSTAAVKTTIPELEVEDPRGYMKFSPDGSKLALANVTDGLFWFDFDPTSGQVSNPREVVFSGVNKDSYGLEFSPNNRFLYVHAINEVQENESNQSSLWQIDLSATDITSSILELDNRPIYRGALQQGKNGKIYRTITRSYELGTPYLGVINNPNEAGNAAGYQHNAINLGEGMAMQGLPPFVQSFFSTRPLVRNQDGTFSSTLEICSGEPLRLEADSIPMALYAWEKDGIPLPGIDTHFLNIAATSDQDSGQYRVVITPSDPTECLVIGESFIDVLSLPQPTLELVQCDVGPDDNSDGIAFVNLHKVSQDPDLQFAFYESPEDRDTNRPIINSENYQNTQAFSQLIYYKVTNGKGCSNQGEFSLIITPATVEASPLSPVYACDIDPADLEMTGNFDLQTLVEGAYDSGLTVDLYASLEDAALQVNEIVESILTSGPSDVYLRLSDGGICLGIEALALSVNPSPSPQMEDTYVLCADQGSTVLVGPPGFDAYRWIKKTTHGSTVAGEGREVRIFEPGNYELEASYIYTAVSGGFQCSNSVEFQVTPSGKASISDIEILDFSENNSVDISVDGTGVYEFSLDGLTYQETPKFTGIPPGFYTLFVRDREGCGTVTEDIAVMGYPKFFTPNGDGFNDYWQLSGTNQLFEPEAFIGIYDRFGSFITQVSVQDRGWNGMANSRMMPAADYWFRITLSNGREIKGHFALKR